MRQYLPKETDLSVYSQEELGEIALKLNARPRKSLGWKCPVEIFLPDFDFKAALAAYLGHILKACRWSRDFRFFQKNRVKNYFCRSAE